jgi:hypothetical protein
MQLKVVVVTVLLISFSIGSVWLFDCSLACAMKTPTLSTYIVGVISAIGALACSIFKPYRSYLPGIVVALLVLGSVPSVRTTPDFCCDDCDVNGTDLVQVASELIKAEEEAVLSNNLDGVLKLYLPSATVADQKNKVSITPQKAEAYYNHLLSRYQILELMHEKPVLQQSPPGGDVFFAKTVSRGKIRDRINNETIDFQGLDIWSFDRSYRCCGWRIGSLTINVGIGGIRTK